MVVAEAEPNILDNRAAAVALYQVRDILMRIICVLVNLGSGGGGRSHGYGLESSGRFAIGPGPTAGGGGVGGC